MPQQPKISLLICTINDRISAVPQVLLSPHRDICYVVSMQYTDDLFLDQIPEELLQRDDVRVYPYFGAGLSANRNHALRHCTTELAIIADDDAHYTLDDLEAVMHLAEDHPEVGVYCLQVSHTDGKPHRNYPAYSFDYAHQPRGNYFVSCELVLRTDALLPTFDIRFGLGAPFLGCGEEEVFLYQAYRLGVKVHYFPLHLCTIPESPTTGSQFLTNKKVRHAKGAVLYVMHGLIGGLLRITLTALRTRKTESRCSLWWDMFLGMQYVWEHPLNEGVADELPLDFQPIDLTKLP